ncbi:MAG: FAD-binding oxidoreductase [Desulfobacteraceae bacterium]|nr:MAG: FAD-binding oxidoreductase [Desulfobacteraceae bacterium]
MEPGTVIPEEIRQIAANCRHYAMCKIDFLETGLCPPGEARPFVSFFPQGRMDLCDGLAKGIVPVTEAAVDIISSCNLCGRCDKQCHFVTGMRPMRVMAALKEFLDEYLRQGGRVVKTEEDDGLRDLRKIVGLEWASNDPAVLLTYSNDPFPLASMRMPRYVVLPGTRDEIVKIIQWAGRSGTPYIVRGNGGSVFGFVFTDGVVIDLNRMKGIEIDTDNWVANVEPGVTSFELQKKTYANGLRVNAAEPAATVCGNIVCTGTFSTWANVYGVGADNFVDMEFVSSGGEVCRLNDKQSPNVFSFEHAVLPSPGICTGASIKMHPTTNDEEGILVPFPSFSQAVYFARDLSRRRIGLAIGILGGHYLSTFMSPSAELADRIRPVFEEALGIKYAVFVVGDSFAKASISTMAPAVIDNRLFRILMLGLPSLALPQWEELIRGFESDKYPYEVLFKEEMLPVIEAVLAPSPETLASAVDEDLRGFYAGLYRRPQMSDLVWLNMFRILSSRMSRHKHMFAFLIYVPLDKVDVIRHIMEEFRRIGDRHSISNDYGFLTPLDLGKRGILEYDYYIDHTDPSESEKIAMAMSEIEPMLEELSARIKGIKFLKYIFSQGCSRKEGYLYT